MPFMWILLVHVTSASREKASAREDLHFTRRPGRCEFFVAKPTLCAAAGTFDRILSAQDEAFLDCLLSKNVQGWQRLISQLPFSVEWLYVTMQGSFKRCFQAK